MQPLLITIYTVSVQSLYIPRSPPTCFQLKTFLLYVFYSIVIVYNLVTNPSLLQISENLCIQITETVNIPNARCVKLILKDTRSANKLKDMVTELKTQWRHFCPDTDIDKNITRINLSIDEGCQRAFLKDKAAVSLLLKGTLGK